MKWKHKSRGLGDTVEKITTASGIKRVVNTVAKMTNSDCGCAKRKEALNRAVPYKDKNYSTPKIVNNVCNKLQDIKTIIKPIKAH